MNRRRTELVADALLTWTEMFHSFNTHTHNKLVRGSDRSWASWLTVAEVVNLLAAAKCLHYLAWVQAYLLAGKSSFTTFVRTMVVSSPPTGRRCCRRQNLRSMEIKSDRLTDYDFCNNSYDFFIEEEMLTFTNSISNCSILIFLP